MLYYWICFIVSVMLGLSYVVHWKKHYDVYMALIFMLIPLINLGYLALARSKSLEEALLANTLTYLGGTMVALLFCLCFLNLCRIKVPRGAKLAFYVLEALYFINIFTAQNHSYFYKSVELVNNGSTSYLVKEYGPIHTMLYITFVVLVIINMSAIIKGLNANKMSNRIVGLMFFVNIFTIVGFIGGRHIKEGFELVPAIYILDDVLFLLISFRMKLLDIEDTVVDSVLMNNDTGYFSFDLKGRFLGANEEAIMVFPTLDVEIIDKPLQFSEELITITKEMIVDVNNQQDEVDRVLEMDDKIMVLTAGFLYLGNKISGYQFRVYDDTKQQQYLKLMERFNAELEHDVAEKTESLIQMQDALIFGMADMVENRDANTGGHIKRTSKVVEILADEMKKAGAFSLELDDYFYKRLVKAAPMHDLGKIAVDDAILRKPGRYEKWEYDVMKTHASKGADIVAGLLTEIDDEEFKSLAENVAHYHHERVDGSGYPEGLKGDEIPIEARIMAIADVYDALVSKRCYKDSMSFEEAFRIIEEGMGSQFDERLNPYFLSARPRLEQYYMENA